MYVCIMYIDKPVVNITTATGGCGYVYVSWTVIGNNDICKINSFSVILLSVQQCINEPRSTDINSYNFTRLPNDTQFDIVISRNDQFNTDLASANVKTKSM